MENEKNEERIIYFKSQTKKKMTASLLRILVSLRPALLLLNVQTLSGMMF